MGILDKLKQATGGGKGAGTGSPTGSMTSMAPLVMGLMNRQGGLGGLLQGFQSRGLGHIVQSWVGTGPNLPISADQVRTGLGEDTINDMATRSGMPAQGLTEQLSRFLPDAVDRLTPNGQVPQGPISESQFSSSGLTDRLGGILGGRKSA